MILLGKLNRKIGLLPSVSLLSSILVISPTSAPAGVLQPGDCVLRSSHEEANGSFGGSVAGVYDVNGDGKGDLIVGAPAEAGGAMGSGRAYIIDGATCQILHTLHSPNPIESFGIWNF